MVRQPDRHGFDAVNAVLDTLDKGELQDIIDAFKKLDLNDVSIPGIDGIPGSSTPETAPIDTDVPVTDETTVDTAVPVTFPTEDTTNDTFPDVGGATAEDFRSQTEEFILGSQVAEQAGFRSPRPSAPRRCRPPSARATPAPPRPPTASSSACRVEITSPSGFTIESVDPA